MCWPEHGVVRAVANTTIIQHSAKREPRSQPCKPEVGKFVKKCCRTATGPSWFCDWVLSCRYSNTNLTVPVVLLVALAGPLMLLGRPFTTALHGVLAHVWHLLHQSEAAALVEALHGPHRTLMHAWRMHNKPPSMQRRIDLHMPLVGTLWRQFWPSNWLASSLLFRWPVSIM